MNGDSGHVIRVMLVEDHPLVRGAINRAISGPDIEVVAETGTAEQALEVAPTARPDVILVDIDLPGMSGVQLVRELAPRLPEAKIVMLTISRDERDLLQSITHGASGYLTKDLTPEALLAAVRGAYQGDLAVQPRLAGTLVRRLVERTRQTSTGSRRGLSTLSERETEVLHLLSTGLTDREIADSLTVSPRTVHAHVRSILEKLDVRNRAEAARIYREGA